MGRPEHLALRLARTSAFARVIGLLERLARWDPEYLPVLTYHRVDEPSAAPDRYPGLVSATPSEFDRQMAYLRERAAPIAMDDLLAARDGGRLPRRAVLVTFDDASEEFGRLAWPILRRHRIPVTLFVPTAFPDDPSRTFWWDDLYGALRRTRRAALDGPTAERLPLDTAADRARAFGILLGHLKGLPHDDAMAALRAILDELGRGPRPDRTVLDWDELRALAREGVTLAAHTRTHPLLTRVTAETATREATGSRQDLEREVGPVPAVFAYPSGAWDQAVAERVAAAGFELGFTTDRGVNHLPTTPPLAMKRINVGRRASLAVIRAQLLPALQRVPGWVRTTAAGGPT